MSDREHNLNLIAQLRQRQQQQLMIQRYLASQQLVEEGTTNSTSSNNNSLDALLLRNHIQQQQQQQQQRSPLLNPSNNQDDNSDGNTPSWSMATGIHNNRKRPFPIQPSALLGVQDAQSDQTASAGNLRSPPANLGSLPGNHGSSSQRLKMFPQGTTAATATAASDENQSIHKASPSLVSRDAAKGESDAQEQESSPPSDSNNEETSNKESSFLSSSPMRAARTAAEDEEEQSERKRQRKDTSGDELATSMETLQVVLDRVDPEFHTQLQLRAKTKDGNDPLFHHVEIVDLAAKSLERLFALVQKLSQNKHRNAASSQLAIGKDATDGERGNDQMAPPGYEQAAAAIARSQGMGSSNQTSRFTFHGADSRPASSPATEPRQDERSKDVDGGNSETANNNNRLASLYSLETANGMLPMSRQNQMLLSLQRGGPALQQQQANPLLALNSGLLSASGLHNSNNMSLPSSLLGGGSLTMPQRMAPESLMGRQNDLLNRQQHAGPAASLWNNSSLSQQQQQQQQQQQLFLGSLYSSMPGLNASRLDDAGNQQPSNNTQPSYLG